MNMVSDMTASQSFNLILSNVYISLAGGSNNPTKPEPSIVRSVKVYILIVNAIMADGPTDRPAIRLTA